MAKKTLAVKYRPTDFNSITEQESIKIILQQQLESDEIKNAYLFCGPAGCGKTTCARIFANDINKGQGNPIEMDAASNSGVDDVRNIIQQAKTKSLDSEYKVFIIDECVTGDTEILTKEGWKRIDSITELDDVAQYTKDGRIEFVANWEYVKKEYSGDMYDVSFRNGKRHVLMSPHHVQPVRMCKSKEIKEQYIQDCKFAQSNEIIVAGKGTGNNELLSCFDRLYIACQADGYCNKNYDRAFWELHLSLPEKVNRALDLLDDCGIDYHIYGDNKKSIRFYYDFPKTKKLSDYFSLDMGVDRAQDFISEILLWDGSTKSGYPGYYSCIDKDNVDFVSAVLTLCGYSGTVNVSSDNNPLHNNVWSVNWYYQDYRTSQAVSKEVVKDWSGTIYCVKVPSQMIVLRAEGFVFISGNCHSISNTGWQAFLKLIEEPPAKSIFIFCTTDPQKIPRTILSRVQRYDFTKISQQGIVSRLEWILHCEMADFDNFSDFTFTKDYAGNWKSGDVVKCEKELDGILVDGVTLIDGNELLKHGHFNLGITYDAEALEYTAKLADGGMRDAISLMDKALAYSNKLTLENVVAALGTTDYDTMFTLVNNIVELETDSVLETIEKFYNDGKDIKQFVKQFTQFLIDIQKYSIMGDKAWKYMSIPHLDTYEGILKAFGDYGVLLDLLDVFVRLNVDIKYSSTPKYDTEAAVMLFMMKGGD